MTKLGSLFDGSGGFPLAGAMHGIEPAWASEIEPYPIRVTTARFPAMKHLGDITKINGAEIEPVDIITFGSPCQDLSVAGKQAGLEHGARSNLFYQAIRIIKEMRDATKGVYPRVAVWENVPGAYSSNHGKDFQAVLQAFCGICDETADVPKPAKWQSAGCIMGNGFSVAWRTLDAQYWGVPQRRRRIYLVADFAGQSAGEILFKQEGLRGDTAESGTAGQSAAGDAERSVGRSVWPTIAGSLRARGDSSPCVDNGQPFVCCAFDNHPRDIDIGVAGTIRSNCHGDVTQVCFAVDAMASNSMKSANPNSGFHEEEIAKCLDTSGGNPSCNQGGNVIVFKERAGCPGGGKGILCGDKPFTLSTLQDQAVCMSVDCRNAALTSMHGTLQAKENGGQSLNYMGAVCYAIDSHQTDCRFNLCNNGVSPTLPARMGTGGNNGPMVLETMQSMGEYKECGVASSIAARDYKSARDLIIKKEGYEYADAKKARCREILLGLWSAYVAEDVQGSAGEQQGIQQTEVLRSEVYGSALDEQTQDRNELHGESCGCENSNGCWVLRNMREAQCKGCASQGRQLSEQQFGQLDADLQGLPQQATQDSGEVQGVREESQRAGILREALSKVQEIWQSKCNKNQPIQRKYIIRRLTPLEACRLQGFPDEWCSRLGTENPSEDEILFWAGVWETHRKILGKSSKPKSRRQIVKWLQDPYSDAAEYKMWGNGIALPCAAFVLGRVAAMLKKGEP